LPQIKRLKSFFLPRLICEICDEKINRKVHKILRKVRKVGVAEFSMQKTAKLCVKIVCDLIKVFENPFNLWLNF